MLGALGLDARSLKGVGPKVESILGNLGIITVGDLLFHLPLRHIDRTKILSISEAEPGKGCLFRGKLSPPIDLVGRRRKRMKAAWLTDSSGSIRCLWFGSGRRFKQWDPKNEVLVSGKISNRLPLVLIHPDVEDQTEESEPFIPVYPLTAGLSQRRLRKIMKYALSVLSDSVPSFVPASVEKSHAWLSLKNALNQVHFPESMTSAESALERVNVEALIPLQLLVLRKRSAIRLLKAPAMGRSVPALAKFIHGLPFVLTADQATALEEIRFDMANPCPMHRLLEGDVGSGKTVVAIAAAIVALEHGFQAAVMAPTEVLAEQHFRVVGSWIKSTGHKAELLTGRTTGQKRKDVLSALSNREPLFVVGTQALIQHGVEFGRLGLIVIDEQHRFGLGQRALLASKGETPHVLVMTATPIPRSLAMTVYGHLDLSVLAHKPPGRKDVKTIFFSKERRHDAVAALRSEIQAGKQGYIVAPLVEESERLEARGAVELFDELGSTDLAGIRLGLLHGRMNSAEKEKTLLSFHRGEIRALVCTTVIEVGLDAPGAGVVLIDGAERFGLAQLHQLRGRVGRDGQDALCILLIGAEPTPEAELRIEALLSTTDGFKLADKDLKIRGPGALLGPRQHGKIGGALTADPRLVVLARECADRIGEGSMGTLHPELEQVLTRLDGSLSLLEAG